jgi:hypothetical protein
MRRDWKPIKAKVNQAAEKLGHQLEPFNRERLSFAGPLRMANCTKCGGCCWISHAQKGFVAGGRLLKFRCGTPEAAGFKSEVTA